MAVPTFTASGNKAATPAKLNATVFGVETTNHELLKQAYDSYLANGRVNLAVTKTRGLVSGGGKKPWKQKGTGRARFGSSRNPIWRGGGIVFGPTGQENYGKKLPVAIKRQALRQALSLANKDGRVLVIERLASKDGKTAELVKLLTKLDISRSALIVVSDKTPELVRATANLTDVKLVSAKYVSVFDVMNADRVVLTQDALKAVEEWLTPSPKATKAEGASTPLSMKGKK